jgi:cysteine synthase A
MVCAVKGYEFAPISSDAFALEKLNTMRALGATLTLMPSEGGMITPRLFRDMSAEARRRAEDPEVFYSDQFHNEDAIRGYMGIGRELVQQQGTAIDVFCAGVGTGGMLVGVARALKEAGCRARIVALEPASSPALTAGGSGAHRIEGIATGTVPPHITPGSYDEARALDESDARAMARRLAREEGIFAGTSTGLNVAAAVRIAEELGEGHTVVTVAVDTGLKYLAGDLFA